MYYNETMQVAHFVMRYPHILLQSVVEDANTEQYAKIAFNILIFFVILVMFFILFCLAILLAKACWVILQGICYWFFGRDTLKEYIIKQREEDREYLKELFKTMKDDIKSLKQ
jgi:hypothetical protein